MDLVKLTKSRIHKKILVFFHENQASIDTPRGVSTWIGEEKTKVRKALEDMVKAEVLVAHRSSSTTGYSYTRNPRVIDRIAELLNKRNS